MSPITELIGGAKAYGWGSLVAAVPAFESIATTTLSTATASVTLSSIPATYTHLQIRGLARSSNAFYNAGMQLRINGDTGANYSLHRLEAEGTSVYSDGFASLTRTQQVSTTGGASLSNNFAVFVIDILDYVNTNKYKTIRTLGAYDNNGNGSGNDRGNIGFNSGSWQNTAAITSISFTLNDASNFVTNSSFALYGIKGA